jgi:hypothetical protein
VAVRGEAIRAKGIDRDEHQVGPIDRYQSRSRQLDALGVPGGGSSSGSDASRRRQPGSSGSPSWRGI